MTTIPGWMQQSENYVPEKDHDGFISKSLLKVMSVLGKVRSAGTIQTKGAAISAPLKLLLCVYLIVLVACAKNMFFCYCMLAVILARICTLSSKVLPRVFVTSLGAALFSALLLLPAIFLGSPHSMVIISCKVFISVSCVGILAASTGWNRLTEGMGLFRVPDLFIFTLDITLKYIVILGDICLDMLNALKLRSVGRNHDKKSAISGILGVTFLKSRQMAEEMHGAMMCRGFEGTYHKKHSYSFTVWDGAAVAFAAAVTALFAYLA
jgi:ABC-type cobalt transport system, permease component CbiQ and related transporters